MVCQHVPILTVTPNPALDVSTSTQVVESEHKLRCSATRLDPGGGGVNVSRVVRNLGGRSLAVYAIGGPTGEAYRNLLEREGVAGLAVRIAESTRESFTVDETSTGRQFRFVLQGPAFTEAEGCALFDAVRGELPGPGLVVASGSLPPGVPDDFYARLARLSREHGARCVVDTSGDALRAALDEGVYLIKPSKRELGELVGDPIDDDAELIEASRELVGAGKCEIVALSLGGDGAIVVSADQALRLPTPKVDVRSTVGAGDSFLAAFLLRIAQGRDLGEALRAGVAAGSATAALPATALVGADDLARLAEGLVPEVI